MGTAVCRKDDVTTGLCLICRCVRSGKIDTASDDVMTNSLGTARDTDTVKADCSHTGKIKATSTSTKVNGKYIGKVGDPFIGDYIGILTNGSPDVTAG